MVDFTVPADYRVKLKENEKKDKYQDLAWEMEKNDKHESDNHTNRGWYSWYRH